MCFYLENIKKIIQVSQMFLFERQKFENQVIENVHLFNDNEHFFCGHSVG